MKKRHGNFKHGECSTQMYSTWAGMISRCYNQNNSKYNDYGGRGISVCERWLYDFKAFRDDMGPRPEGTTIDRIDNDGPYSPKNCRWATKHIQIRNRRSANLITAFGEEKIAADWAEDARCVVNKSTLRMRLWRGMDPEKAITCPLIPPPKKIPQNHEKRGKPKNNTSGYKGVCWSRWAKKWMANFAGKHLGYFDDPAEASKAYSAAKRGIPVRIEA